MWWRWRTGNCRQEMADKTWAYFTVTEREQKSFNEYAEGLTDGSGGVASPVTPLSIQWSLIAAAHPSTPLHKIRPASSYKNAFAPTKVVYFKPRKFLNLRSSQPLQSSGIWSHVVQELFTDTSIFGVENIFWCILCIVCLAMKMEVVFSCELSVKYKASYPGG